MTLTYRQGATFIASHEDENYDHIRWVEVLSITSGSETALVKPFYGKKANRQSYEINKYQLGEFTWYIHHD